MMPQNTIANNENTSGLEFSKTLNPMKNKYIWLILAVLAAITVLTYSSILDNEFLNWDDDTYVTHNPDIRNLQLQHLKVFFKENHKTTFLPLTMISFAIDYQIGELNPQVYTTTNLLLHIINALLVFWLLLLLLKAHPGKIGENNKPYFLAAITAVFFAIHPLNVESVAWISERKNLLYTLFFLLSLIVYLKYINKNKSYLYLLSILFYIFSLFSKGSAVSLSLTVVAIDYLFKRDLFSRKVILEKIPYFILSLIFGIITIETASKNQYFQPYHPFYEQFIFAWYGFIGYLSKFLVPINFSAFYPYPQKITFIYWLCCILSLSIGFILIRYWKKLPRIIAFAILFYLANIIFLIQLYPVGMAIMADRYIYVSSIGFFLIVGFFLINLKNKSPYLFYPVLGILIILLGIITHEHVKDWNKSFSFWDKLITYDKNIPIAWNNRGLIKKDNGDFSGATDDYRTAIDILPTYGDAYYNLANIERMNADFDSALDDYNMAIKIMPDHRDAYFCRGIVFYWLHKKQEAISDFSKAIKIDPGFGNAYYYRSIMKSENKDYLGALGDLNHAVSNSPRFKEAYNYRGLIYSELGKINESYSDFSKAIDLDPVYAEAYFNRGKLNDLSKNLQAALDDLNQAIMLEPRYLKALILRAKVKTKMGDMEDAIKDCEAALYINKNSSEAKEVRAYAINNLKNYKKP